jgi:hypothetical protein
VRNRWDETWHRLRAPTAALLLAGCGATVAADAAPTDGGNESLATGDATREASPFDATTLDGATRVPEAAPISDAATGDTAISDATQDDIAADSPDDVGPGDSGQHVADASPYPDDAEASAPCDADAGCYVIPSGWSLVAYSTTQTSCPSGFAAAPPTNFSGYAQSTTACTCGGCTFSYATCNSSGIRGYYDVNNGGPSACSSADPATDLYNNAAGTCQTDLPQGDYSGLDLEYVAPPVQGSCGSAGPAILTSPVTFPWQGETCSPDTDASLGCNDNECTVSLPPPFRVCVSASPSRTCPANSIFTQRYVGAVGPSASCGVCNCSVNATCSGTMQLFSDTQCANNEFDVAADGICNRAPLGIATVGSYRYSANAPTNVSCVPDGPSMVLTSWQYAVTVCCAP